MRTIFGYAVMGVGLILAVVAMGASSHYPAEPLAKFIGAAFLLGVPFMLIGGRMAYRSEKPALSESELEAEYNRDTFRVASSLGFSAMLTSFLVAPVIIMGIGLVPWDSGLLALWGVGWCVVVRLGCPWVVRPLHAAFERASLKWYDRNHVQPDTAAENQSQFPLK